MHPSTTSLSSVLLRSLVSAVLVTLVAGCATIRTPSLPDQAPAVSTPKSPGIARGISEHQLRIADFASAGNAIPEGSVGYFMDVHQARLLQLLPPNTQIEIERHGNSLRVILPGRLTFDQGSSRVSPGMTDLLVNLGDILAEFDRTAVVVNGHTDSRGDAGFNQTLSERRALAVAQLLLGQSLDPRRLAAIGHGESQPIADNDSEQGRTANRRIAIDITPVLATMAGE